VAAFDSVLGAVAADAEGPAGFTAPRGALTLRVARATPARGNAGAALAAAGRALAREATSSGVGEGPGAFGHGPRLTGIGICGTDGAAFAGSAGTRNWRMTTVAPRALPARAERPRDPPGAAALHGLGAAATGSERRPVGVDGNFFATLGRPAPGVSRRHLLLGRRKVPERAFPDCESKCLCALQISNGGADARTAVLVQERGYVLAADEREPSPKGFHAAAFPRHLEALADPWQRPRLIASSRTGSQPKSRPAARCRRVLRIVDRRLDPRPG
jgi:hypothetical protein